jgi:hypothetical protein
MAEFPDMIDGGSDAPENLPRNPTFTPLATSCTVTVSWFLSVRNELNVSTIRVPGGEVTLHVQFIRGR